MKLTDAQKVEVGLTPPPGIYLNVPARLYFAWPYLSKSALHDFATSPATWYARHTGQLPHKASKSYTLGSATDTLWVERKALEPTNGWQIVPAINPLTDKPMPKSGKVRAEYLASLPEGVTALTKNEADKAHAMHTALSLNDRACELHRGSVAQVSLVWDCPHTGLRLKGRPDLVDFERRILCDLKTAKEVNPWQFDRDASAYNYHWQLHLYTQGLGGGDWQQWLITVRNAPLHAVACRPMPASALELAEHEVTAQLRKWLQCRNANHWPADLLDETPIKLPGWRFKQGGF